MTNNRDNIVKRLNSKGIDTRIAYPKPVYDQELYKAGIAKFRKYKVQLPKSLHPKLLIYRFILL